jgi:transposase
MNAGFYGKICAMPAPRSAPVPTLAEAAQWAPERVVALAQAHEDLQRQVQTIQHQLEWFRRQLFGQKSEKRLVPPDPAQMYLGELPIPESQPDTPGKTVAGHTRRASRTDYAQDKDESALFFDETRVPVETITLANPETEGLARRPVRGDRREGQPPPGAAPGQLRDPQVRAPGHQAPRHADDPLPGGAGRRDRGQPRRRELPGRAAARQVRLAPAAVPPASALGRCRHHGQPRLAHAVGRTGRRAARADLRGAIGVDPRQPRQGHGRDPDQGRPCRPGQDEGLLLLAGVWRAARDLLPVLRSRAHSNVEKVLGLEPAEGGVLLSDGYGAYESYASKTGLTHAQCWTHCRREFINAEAAEPELAAEAIAFIGALYAVEAKIRDDKLKGEAKREYRLDHARPIVAAFFTWVQERQDAQGLLPSNPLTKALIYAHKRRAALEVFLADPDVPIDTNHLERALRPIPIGRKNWMFSWTELGAQHVGVVQSLIATCRLHEVDPYDYLVDVLQRVGQHPAADVAQLTPRLWKQHFGKAPLRSDISSRAA